MRTFGATYAKAANFPDAAKTEEAALAESAQHGDAGLEAVLWRHRELYESNHPVRTP
jgi:hypothetical protein